MRKDGGSKNIAEKGESDYGMRVGEMAINRFYRLIQMYSSGRCFYENRIY